MYIRPKDKSGELFFVLVHELNQTCQLTSQGWKRLVCIQCSYLLQHPGALNLEDHREANEKQQKGKKFRGL